jgi:hypothetical protein
LPELLVLPGALVGSTFVGWVIEVGTGVQIAVSFTGVAFPAFAEVVDCPGRQALE